MTRLVKNSLVLAALLVVACGGRTAIESELSSSPQATGGSAGAPDFLDWDEIVWDDGRPEAAVHLWTGSATSTWAVVTDNLGSFHREHWDGLRWTRTVAEKDPSAPFEDAQVWAVADGHALGGSSTELQRWFGSSWVDWAGSPGCRALGGSALDDVWCATDTELWRYDGARWTRQPMAGTHGILARARNDVWVWGEQGASHFDGTRWSLELSNLVKRVSASGPSEVWAVQDGTLLHSAGPGSAWTSQNPTGGQIAAVWSESPTNTWVVAAGAAMRWNGVTWKLMPLPGEDERLFLSGSSEDIWIAGTLTLIHGHPVRRSR